MLSNCYLNSRGYFIFCIKKNKNKKEFVVLEIKRKLKLSIEVSEDLLDIVDIGNENSDEIMVAMASFSGKIEMYQIFIIDGLELCYKKIFSFCDKKFPVLKLVFCPYSKFVYFLVIIFCRFSFVTASEESLYVWDISPLLIAFDAMSSKSEELVFNTNSFQFQNICQHLYTFLRVILPEQSLLQSSFSLINFINFYPNCNHLLVLLKDGRLYFFNVRTHHRIDLLYRLPQIYSTTNQSSQFSYEDPRSSSNKAANKGDNNEHSLSFEPYRNRSVHATLPFVPEKATLFTYTVPSFPYTPSSAIIMHIYRYFYVLSNFSFTIRSHPNYLPLFFHGLDSGFGKRFFEPTNNNAEKKEVKESDIEKKEEKKKKEEEEEKEEHAERIKKEKKSDEKKKDVCNSNSFRIGVVFLYDKRFNYLVYRAHMNDLIRREVFLL
jgi:hypothetical protein